MRNLLNVKLLRKSLGLNQDVICEEFGIKRSTWSNFERTNTFPDELLVAIQKKYASQIADLGSLVMEEQADYFTVTTLQKRIEELELMLKQKDILIANQQAVIEMQNQTYLALKQQYQKK